jgi:cbb3-type cytochrome oxidase subunit 1
MDWFVKAFIKASVVWLVVGMLAGIAMAVHPVWTVHRAAHVHLMLLGFVMMMICGVAYHVLPRFVGVPLPSPRAAAWHWWIANAGLIVMLGGFVLRDTGRASGTVLVSLGGSLSGIGTLIFAWLVWRTLDARAPGRQVAKGAPGTASRLPLPVAFPS